MVPTDKWKLQGDKTYKHDLLYDAWIGRLYVAADGYYVSVVPTSMFTETRSCKILTYLAEGSLMAMYLDKYGIPYTVNRRLDIDNEARAVARQRLNIIKFDPKVGHLGYKRQSNFGSASKKKISNKLLNLRVGPLKGVPIQNIMVTCRKDLWFMKDGNKTRMAVNSRLGSANWCHKSTKGTNLYRKCTHAVHMFQLNMNPSIAKFLNVDDEREKQWRQSEMIQWLYRSNIRQKDGGEVTLLIVDEDAIQSIKSWLYEDVTDNGVVEDF